VPPEHRSSLWDFSLALYARPSVADACLQLQDEQGVNVNLLLWCVWLEARGLRLDEARLGRAHAAIRSWDEHYVIPLRHLRRRMKMEFGVHDAGIEQLRSQIKHAELLAEKQLQLCLENEVQNWICNDPINPLSAGENLRFYLQQCQVSAAAIAQLQTLLERA
jgi:uncharacterized protein (TIGR02444 family)